MKPDPLHSEREHQTAPLTAVPLSTAQISAVPPDPIDAPFNVELAFASKWFAPRGAIPTSVVIHCTAATNPAASTAAFFASSADSGSTQAVADDLEGFTCVPDDAVCAGAPPLNQEGLHIEQPGLVTWSRATWLSHDNQLRRVAYHVAQWCNNYQIPIVLLKTADLTTEKARGITAHMWVSERWHQSTHTDPGPNFPWDVFMPMVAAYAAGGDDLSVLTDDEQYQLRGLLRRFRKQGPPVPASNQGVKDGFTFTDVVIDEAMASPPPVGLTEHKHVPGAVQKP